MQIIQISDLHITADSSLDSHKDRVTRLYDALKINLRKDECTVFCVLGDIVDKGNANSYKKALELFNHIKEVFGEFNPKFEFTPGNHDLCDCPYPHPTPNICPDQKCTISHYNDFAKSFDNSYDPTNSLSHREYDDIDLLLASSVFHGNCRYGLIAIEALKRVELKKPALLVTHHTFFSENDTDISAIRNAYKLFDEIENKEILGVLHGHTHGYKDITIGEKCKVVGVGPFLKDIPNINNQVNLVIATSSGIHNIINYFYREDFDKFETQNVYYREKSFYCSSNIEKSYSRIVTDTKKYGVLSNMYLNLSMLYQDFVEQIEKLFPAQIHTAALWQETEVIPENFYYNHGQYMKYNGVSAMNFVIDELKSKATSSRAIIPLINFEDVIKSGDGFLPSFDLVQFGFLEEEKTHLLVTLYLRALEVNHFLKINLCEIYLMSKKIADEIRSIEKIDVNILAFKAQYKEKFGCFKRAALDTVSESDIAYSLIDNLESVVQWLLEKKDFNETVVELKGIQSFCNALQSANTRKKIKPIILSTASSILSTMEHLKREREKTSNYKSIAVTETNLNKQLDELIEILQRGEIHESQSNH